MTSTPRAAPRLPPSALAHWDALERDIDGRTPAMFIDYDGTLTPIVERPDRAVLSEPMRRIVRRLAARFPTTIVSGRGREDVARLIALDDVGVAGSHGFDIAVHNADGQPIRHEVAGEIVPVIRAAARRLETALAGIDGVLIEPKTFTVAVHYRAVAEEDLDALDAVLERVLADHPELRKAPGKKVFELRPRIDWDKGKAVLWLLEQLRLDRPDFVPIFLGDDVTDEDAFRALERRGIGIAVIAAPRPTVAQYTLHDTDEVGRLLERISELPPTREERHT